MYRLSKHSSDHYVRCHDRMKLKDIREDFKFHIFSLFFFLANNLQIFICRYLALAFGINYYLLHVYVYSLNLFLQ